MERIPRSYGPPIRSDRIDHRRGIRSPGGGQLRCTKRGRWVFPRLRIRIDHLSVWRQMQTDHRG
eukprot:scaffold45_cov337-Pavlova_lutheri.AAC.28